MDVLTTEAARLYDTRAYFESEDALHEELYHCGYLRRRDPLTEEDYAALPARGDEALISRLETLGLLDR